VDRSAVDVGLCIGWTCVDRSVVGVGLYSGGVYVGQSGVDVGLCIGGTRVDRSVVDGGLYGSGSGGSTADVDSVPTAVAVAVSVTVTVTAGDAGNKTAKAPGALAAAQRDILRIGPAGAATGRTRECQPLSFHPLVVSAWWPNTGKNERLLVVDRRPRPPPTAKQATARASGSHARTAIFIQQQPPLPAPGKQFTRLPSPNRPFIAFILGGNPIFWKIKFPS